MSDPSVPRVLPDGALEGVTLSGGYQVGEKLGKGGMAWVYGATLDENLCALKILFSHMSDDEEFKARFLREARIQQSLTHPNIVRVTDFIEERGLVGFVLEYCDGGTLLDLLKELRGPMPLKQIEQIFLPLIDAMGYAHEQGVIHRDLKPPNILLHNVVEDGKETLTPKLTDFGIAKLFGDATLTQTGTMIGTLLYMSPEQVEESKYVDARADIYSLGVLLYQLISGTLPFLGKSSALMMQILNDEPPPPPRGHPALVDVVMRTLRKDPDERYQTCDELAEAVATALKESASNPAQRQAPPHPRIAAGAADARETGPISIGTLSLQGSSGIRPGGADTIDDLDAVGEANTLQLDTNDIVSARERARAMAEKQLEAAEARAAASDVSTHSSRPAKKVEQVEELAPALSADDLPSASPVVSSAVIEGAGLAEPQPPDKSLSDEARQSVLLSLVAFGLIATIVGLWLARDEQGYYAPPKIRVRTKAPTKRVRPTPPVRKKKAALPARKRPAKKKQVKPRVRPKPGRKKPVALRPPGLDDSLAALKQRCESGDAPSCRHWGLRLARSTNITKQHRARQSMGHACDLRDLRACVVLGFWHYKGQLGLPVSVPKAKKIWMRACRMGARAICFRLGRLWHEQNEIGKACTLYKRACLKQHAEGCRWQGWCVLQKTKRRRKRRRRRRRLSKRRRKAYLRQTMRLFRSACDLSDGVGCNRLGVMISDGSVTAPNEEKARKLFKRACALRSAHGCFNMALYAMAGRGGMPNPGLAKGALDQACTLGDGPACYLLGTLVLKESKRADDEERRRALQLFADACRYKMAQGCYHAGYLMARGEVGVPSCAMATPWLKRACTLGLRPCRRCGRRRRLSKPPKLKPMTVRWLSLSEVQ